MNTNAMNTNTGANNSGYSFRQNPQQTLKGEAYYQEVKGNNDRNQQNAKIRDDANALNNAFGSMSMVSMNRGGKRSKRRRTNKRRRTFRKKRSTKRRR